MSQKNIQFAFLVLSTIILFVLSFLIFKPYLGVVFLAAVLTASFYPLFLKVTDWCHGRKHLASFLVIGIIIVGIIIPLVFLSTQLLKEAADVYNNIAFGEGDNVLVSSSNAALQKVQTLFASETFQTLDLDAKLYIRNVLSWVINHVDSVFAVIFNGLFNFVLMILSIYYLFINGEKIKKALIHWSPLPDTHDEHFLDTLYASVDAVLKGRILVSIAQGVLVGVGFAIFGIGSPVFWGFVGAIASLVPIIGTSIVMVPAILFLFITGSVYMAIGLLVWAFICVGFIDNVLSFFFLKNKIRVHPLIILFSIIGGVEAFGTIGFLFGPIVVSALLSLMKIYPHIIHAPKSN